MDDAQTPLTLGEFRAATADEPDHIVMVVPIPACTIDGSQGEDYVDVTGIRVSGDAIDIEYTRPDAWALNSDAERRQYTADRRYAAAYLAAADGAVSEAVRMPLEVRLGGLLDEGALVFPGGSDPAGALAALVAALHEDLTIGLAGAAARHLST